MLKNKFCIQNIIIVHCDLVCLLSFYFKIFTLIISMCIYVYICWCKLLNGRLGCFKYIIKCNLADIWFLATLHLEHNLEIFNCVRVILDRPKARILGVDYETRKYEETTISRAEGVGKIATIRGNFSENYTQPYTCIFTFYFWRGDYCVIFFYWSFSEREGFFSK